MSDSVRPHRQQPTRLPRPWDSPGKNTGVGCHFLLQCMKVKMKVKSLSRSRLFETPWTVAYQAPLSMDFPGKSTGVGCHCLLRALRSVLHKILFELISSVQFSSSVMSNSLRPHESQHAGLPVHHQLPEFTQTHVHRVGDAIQPSHPLSSPSPLAPNPSHHQSLFQ